MSRVGRVEADRHKKFQLGMFEGNLGSMQLKKESSSHVHVVNAIEVPQGMERTAEKVRNEYVNYFRRQTGFVSSTFYRATDDKSDYHYINVVVWASKEDFEAVVNLGFKNADGTNADGLKVLGQGFPKPIVVHPGRYQVISEDAGLPVEYDENENRGHLETGKPDCITRGDLYWIAQGRDKTTPAIWHPHVVVQDDVFNQSRINTIVVCALTSNLVRANEPGNVLLNLGEGNLERQSIVIVSQVTSVERSAVGAYIGKLEPSRVEQVLSGLRFQQRAFFGKGR